ncbi:MAG: ATP-binding protein [Casimicrobiaceae bacterium]
MLGQQINLLEHVFDPFQNSDAQSGHKSGLGLGLYIVHQIVKAHGGTALA